MAAALPDSTRIGPVTLRVADARRSIDFYTALLGFDIIEQTNRRVCIGVGERTLCVLDVKPGIAPCPPRASGLFHVAYLYPRRTDLARRLAHVVHSGVVPNAADHSVSEAIYLDDPDDNGVELYRDRPRSDWSFENGMLLMPTRRLGIHDLFEQLRVNAGDADAGNVGGEGGFRAGARGAVLGDLKMPEPVDVSGVLAEAGEDISRPEPAPAGTRVGHVHLQVSDLEKAERFYRDGLGFAVTFRLPGAVFLSAGTYHHFIGLNTWRSLGGPPPSPDTAGLAEFVIELPPAAIAELATRLKAGGFAATNEGDELVTQDPTGTKIRAREPV